MYSGSLLPVSPLQPRTQLTHPHLHTSLRIEECNSSYLSSFCKQKRVLEVFFVFFFKSFFTSYGITGLKTYFFLSPELPFINISSMLVAL